MQKAVITRFFEHVDRINFVLKCHLDIFPQIEILVLFQRNFIYAVFVIREDVVIPAEKKVFGMNRFFMVAYLVIREYPLVTIIIKNISVGMPAQIDNTTFKSGIFAPVL